jgi:hypothetical protein
MSSNVIRCCKTGKSLAFKLDGGWCNCPLGRCLEEDVQVKPWEDAPNSPPSQDSN